MERQVDVRSQGIYSLQYVLLAATSMLFFGSMYFAMPVLPLYAVAIGADASQVGLVLGAFTVTAVLCRLYAGSLCDRLGRKPALLAGILVYILAPLAYLVTKTIPLLLLARALNGVGIALFSVASWAIVADLVPPRRRREGMGIFGLAAVVSMAIVPPLALPLLEIIGYDALFVTASATAAASLLLGLAVSDQGRDTAVRITGPAAFSDVVRHGWLLSPSLALAAGAVTFGAVLSYLPLFAAERGLGNAGLFYGVYAFATMITRIPLGRLSDAIGPTRILVRHSSCWPA